MDRTPGMSITVAGCAVFSGGAAPPDEDAFAVSSGAAGVTAPDVPGGGLLAGGAAGAVDALGGALVAGAGGGAALAGAPDCCVAAGTVGIAENDRQAVLAVADHHDLGVGRLREQ
jgi:hypothetical protein